MSTEPAPRLLLIDDDPVVRGSVSRTLGRQGFEVVQAADATEALEAVRAQTMDVALVDVGLPDGRSGIELMQELKAIDGALECVVFTGDASASRAVAAYEAGAAEFLEKPITDGNRFQTVLRRAVRLSRLTRENAELQERGGGEGEAEAIVRRLLVGGSKAMDGIRGQIVRLAPRNTTVLLLGPTGSGKTRIAEALHRASGRPGRFEVVNCGALDGPTMNAELFGHEKGAFTGATDRHRGAFERTAEGTIVLDEIGDLPLELQAKLLQVLEERTFFRMKGSEPLRMTSRVVAATNREIDELVAAGRFRADLANRLGIRVRVPGLAERREDIPRLVYLFLQEVNRREGLDIRSCPPEVLQRLAAHDWSGENLRGLRTAVERMAIFARGDALDADDLGDVGGSAAPAEGGGETLPEAWWSLPYADFKEAVLAEFIGRYVQRLLRHTEGNVSAAARAAGMHGPNFRRLMRRFDIDPPEG